MSARRPASVDLIVLLGVLGAATGLLRTPPAELAVAAIATLGVWAGMRVALGRRSAEARVAACARAAPVPLLLLALATGVAALRDSPWAASVRALQFTAEPETMLLRDGDDRLWLADLRTGERRAGQRPATDGAILAVSPDGTHVVRGFRHQVGTTDFYYSTISVWTVGPDARLILSSGTRGDVAIAPGGRLMAAFADSHEGGGELVVQELGREAKPQPIRLSKGESWALGRRGLAWSPDGQTLWACKELDDPPSRYAVWRWRAADWGTSAHVATVESPTPDRPRLFGVPGGLLMGFGREVWVIEGGRGRYALDAEVSAASAEGGAWLTLGGGVLTRLGEPMDAWRLPGGPSALSPTRAAVTLGGKVALYETRTGRRLRVVGRYHPARRLALTLLAGVLVAFAVHWVGAMPEAGALRMGWWRLTLALGAAGALGGFALTGAVRGQALPPLALQAYGCVAAVLLAASWRATDGPKGEALAGVVMPVCAALAPLLGWVVGVRL